MSAIIIQFPSMHERNDREFERFGSTSYTRAVEEAHTLGSLSNQLLLGRAAVLGRVDALELVLLGLATWREEIECIIPIELLAGVEVRIPLCDVPDFLRSAVGRLEETAAAAPKAA